jgi:two-component system sensor histidine kinase PilS (NtrC family)
MADSGTMVGMLQRTWGRLGVSDASAPFLPLSFRLFASFGLLVVHAALPAEGRAAGPGELAYLAALLLMFVEAAWESGRGLAAMDRLFPTPRLPWIRWNLALDLVLVTLVIAFQGVVQERFATLYIFPVLASAFYLGTVEIVWVGVISSFTHVVLVLGFTFGLIPPFGLSGELLNPDPSRLSFLLGTASLQVFAATLLVVLIRRNLDRLRTDLSVSEAAVDELSALHQRVVESMNSGLITLDLKGRVTSANPAARSILGVPIETGAAIQDLLQLGNPLPWRQGREHRFEVVLNVQGRGRRILGGHLASLRGASGRESGQLLLFQDLTDLKALEERTRISERLAAIGQLAAGLAHELRNPLASISGCVQLLQKEGSPEDVRTRVLGILERETHRVGDIVSDFLDFARPEPPRGMVLQLPKVIEEVRSSWEMDPRTAGLPLTIEPVPQVQLRSDPTGLHRALVNLLSNARKAVKERPNPMVRLSSHVSDATVCLTIRDNGCGMSTDQLERLFVPFAGSFEEGSGLGMSLVYKFIEAMDWRIDVESEAGTGTTIRLFLPLLGEEELVASPSDQA